MSYRVVYAVDSLDPNPEIMEFDEEWEAQDWAHMAVQGRVEMIVSHSPHTVSESELQELYDTEYSLIRIEKMD